MSGGGFLLLSSNSATTVAGRIDLDYHRSGNLTSAIINLLLLSSRTVVLTSFPTSIVLPRFGLVSSYRYSFPSIWFPKLIGNSIFFFIILVKHFFNYFLTIFIFLDFIESFFAENFINIMFLKIIYLFYLIFLSNLGLCIYAYRHTKRPPRGRSFVFRSN